MNKYQGEKIQKTSFLDKAFMKTLAGAVRFGTTLLVENVEKLDPVLNPILNKEIQRTGGRCEFLLGMVVQHVGLLLDDGLNVFFLCHPPLLKTKVWFGLERKMLITVPSSKLSSQLRIPR